MTTHRLRIILVVVVLLTLIFGVFAGRALPATIPDPTNLDSMSRLYHCGDYRHGKTVRGYLIGKGGTYLHIKSVPPETLLLWNQRGVFALPCQK